MPAVIVAVLDRDSWEANTDVIVLVDARKEQLVWIPRDLWSDRIHNRINKAFSLGGGALLLAALRDLGFSAQGVLCLRRSATEAALADVDVTVPVEKPMDYWYPMHPTLLVQDGRKMISFRPPTERLTGERVHQWIGARKAVNGLGSDFQRLERQGTLLKTLLAAGFNFKRVVQDPDLKRTYGRNPFPILVKVSPDWRFTVFNRVNNAKIDGKSVLVRKKPLPRWRRFLRHLRWTLLRR